MILASCSGEEEKFKVKVFFIFIYLFKLWWPACSIENKKRFDKGHYCKQIFMIKKIVPVCKEYMCLVFELVAAG